MDLIAACERSLDRDTAQKGVRNLCRFFGGGMYYIPINKTTNRMITEMRETLLRTVGERGAKIIMEKMVALYGGLQIYIPLERSAFEDVIAEEIYRRNMEENESLYFMFRDYNICFNRVYRLWKKGQTIKLNRERKR
jgi:Mor family transcriptional regulator